MMRVFLYESITGGSLAGESLPASLAREGDLMISALVEDFLRLPGIEIIMTRDRRLPAPAGVAKVLWIDDRNSFLQAWDQACTFCDAVWPIAPETGGELEQICLDIEKRRRTLLAPGSAAVHLAASKLATIRTLEACGVPVVPTISATAAGNAHPGRWVLKPDDGVGCLRSRIVESEALDMALQALEDREHWVVQPLTEGISASLSLIFDRGRVRLLSVNYQDMRIEQNAFRLAGCAVNAIPDADGAYTELACRIAAAIPELFGYAGVDFLITEAGPKVLEINPRLTTSYCGLYAATRINVAKLVLDAAAGKSWSYPTHITRGRVDVSLEPACAD